LGGVVVEVIEVVVGQRGGRRRRDRRSSSGSVVVEVIEVVVGIVEIVVEARRGFGCGCWRRDRAGVRGGDAAELGGKREGLRFVLGEIGQGVVARAGEVAHARERGVTICEA
jgi:hypothetical protein